MEKERITILLIENELLTPIMETKALRKEGFDVILVKEGSEAIKAVENNLRINLILIDIDLGCDIDGFKIAKEILQKRDIPIIFISSHADRKIIKKIETIPIYGYVLKDSSFTVLLTSIIIALKQFEIKQFNLATYTSKESNQSLPQGKIQYLAKELEENEEKTHMIMMNLPIMVLIHQSEKIVYYNNAVIMQTGFLPEEMKNKTIYDFIDEESKQKVSQNMAKRLSGKSVEDYDIFLRTKSDRRIKVKVQASLINYNNDIAFLIVLSDLTDRDDAEERFRAIFENSTSAIAIIEGDTTISMVNDAYCRISGYSREEVVGMSWTKQIPPNDLHRLLEYNRRRLINPQDAPDEYEFTFYKRDNEIRHALMSIALIPNTHRAIAAFNDITARKQTEEQLVQINERLFLATHAAKLGVWDLDFTNHTLEWDDRMLELYGLSRNEFIGSYDGWLSRVHPDDKTFCEEESKKALDKEKDYNTEFRIIWPDQSIHYLKSYGQIIRDVKDTPKRVIGINYDITDLKRMENTLLFLAKSEWIKEKEDFFKCLARFLAQLLTMDYVCIDELSDDNLAAQTVAVYSDGKFNDNEYYTLADTPCGSAVGKSICVYSKDISTLFPNDKALLNLKAESYIGTTLRSAEGLPIGLIALISRKQLTQDSLQLNPILQLVSARAASEMERRRAEKQLHELVTAKEILIRETQHRVKNNLNVVSSLLSLEKEKLSDEKAIQIFDDAMNRIRSMSKIYERLYFSSDLKNLDFSVYIAELAESIFNTYSLLQKKVSLRLQLEELFLDPKRAIPLGLILNELLSNALKYAFPGKYTGEIAVILAVEEDIVSLTVKDNGVGLPLGTDLFTSQSMGMTLINLLCDQLHATLNIDSKEGTCISICFDLY